MEDSLKFVENNAISSSQDGNLSPFRDALEKASSLGLSTNDLAPYRSAYQDLHSRLNSVREIVVGTKEKHHTKLQRALEQARALKSTFSLLTENNNNNDGIELGQSRSTSADSSEFIRLMKEGETGVHKMLKDAIQSGTSVLSHLEAVVSVRTLLETSISTEDKIGLEDVIIRGGALGMTREVESAKSALRAMDKVRIKCHLHTDIRILSVPRDIQFPELKTKIEQTYNSTSSFVMKYRDDVGDLITLASHEDLNNALLTMEAAVETTPTSARKKTSNPKLDVFLALPTNSPTSVRASLEGTKCYYYF